MQEKLQNCPAYANFLYLWLLLRKHRYCYFLWFFKVRKFALLRPWPRNSEDWTSKHVTSSKDWCFTSGENICEHTIVWFKIVVECKEDVFFWGIRSTAWLGERERERAVVFIQYLYLDDSPTYGRETKTNEVCWPLINWTKGRSHQGVPRFWVRRYFKKSRLFVVCILFCSF